MLPVPPLWLAQLSAGDRIKLDVAGRRIELLVDDAELKKRAAEWKAPPVPEVARQCARKGVGGMVIIDSFAGRTLNSLAQMLLLRGVRSVVVGIRPAVAFAMVQLGLRLEGVETALDLDSGLALLEADAPPAAEPTT